MAQFATAAELATRLGVVFTAGETTDANALLTLASTLIQSEADQTIELVNNDTLTRNGYAGARLRLPERPVVNVDSVVLDGVTIPASEYVVEGDELVREAGWGDPEDVLVITYDHGFSPVPGLVKILCLELCVRAWVNPGAVNAEAIGSESITYGATVGMLLSDSERASLHRLFRRGGGLGSITLR